MSQTAAPARASTAPIAPSSAFTLDSLMTRLTGTATGSWRGVLGPAAVWVPLAIMLVAGLLRFWNLDHPGKIIFDETYYVKDAWSYLHFGYEREWPKEIDKAFADGTARPLDQPEYVVHPPLGKWIITLGMLVFGTESGLGWRAGSALMGTLGVLFVTLAAQRLFRSVPLAAVAGIFMTLDGQQVVLSRTGILDISYGTLTALCLYLALVDRDSGRRRLARKIAAAAEAGGGVPSKDFLRWGPWIGLRPWRIALGVSLGALCGIKWSGLAFIGVFGLLIVWWDCQARRTAGIHRWLAAGALRDGLPGFLQVVPVALGAYLATWTGWFLHSAAYGHGLTAKATGWVTMVPEPLRDLWNYHSTAYTFHQGLTSPHPAASNPWTWLFAGRPVLFQYDTSSEHGVPCDAGKTCIQVITELPNPVLWWAGTAAILVVLWAFLAKRDWRALALLAGMVAGYIPWLFFPYRTMFLFYTTGYQAFMVLAVVYALSLLALPRGASVRRIRIGSGIILGFTLLVVLVSWWFWPVWTGQTITPELYRLRTWFPSWG